MAKYIRRTGNNITSTHNPSIVMKVSKWLLIVVVAQLISALVASIALYKTSTAKECKHSFPMKGYSFVRNTKTGLVSVFDSTKIIVTFYDSIKRN
jgi:hypothetical protein